MITTGAVYPVKWLIYACSFIHKQKIFLPW